MPTKKSASKGKSGKKGEAGKARFRGQDNASATDKINRASIRRMCRKGGVRTISGAIYPHVRTLIGSITKNALRKAAIYASTSGRKTIKNIDVKMSTGLSGIKIYGEVNGNSKKKKRSSGSSNDNKEDETASAKS